MSVRLSHLRITASAGTGKTFRLTDRIVELLLLGVEPRRILALTFTRKAAGEFLRKLLEKLAQGAEKPGEAKKFFERRKASAEESGLKELAKHYAARAAQPEATQREEFRKALRKVVEDLDRLEMGTLDSFLFRLVRGFAPELGLNREVRVLDEAAEEREEAEVLGELAAALGTDTKLRDQLRRDLIGGEKGAAPADPLQAEVRELQDAERLWCEEAGAAWGGEKQLFPRGQPPVAKMKEPAWNGLPAGWGEFPEAVREVAAAGPGTELSGKAKKLLENIRELEAGQAEFVFNRKPGVLSGDPALYAGAVARGYVGRLVAWRLGRTRRLGEYAERLAHVRELRRTRSGLLRFADLPKIAQNEVVEVPTLAYRLDGWFDHWLLDEFQDTSRSQWSALDPLVREVWQDNEGRRTLFYVGDVKQAIYGWRGGDAGLFTDIAQGYEGRLKDEQLGRSYRSGERVLKAVEAVFQPKALRAAGVPEEVVAGWEKGWTGHEVSESNRGKGHVEIRAAEGEEIWSFVTSLVKETKILEKGGTVGVLTRTNDLAHEGAEFLSQEGLRVTVEGKRLVVAEGPLGPACLLAARLAANPSDRLAAGGLRAGMLADALAGGAEKFALHSMAEFANGGAEGMVRGWLASVEISDNAFLKDLSEALLRAGRAFDRSVGGSVREFHRFLAEYQDPGATLRGAVQLMTMHKAKGLEFDLTLVVLERGWGRSLKLDSAKGPHLRSGGEAGARWVMELPSQEVCDAVPELAAEMQKVKREASLANLCLHYVAMTRARQALWVIVPPVKEAKVRSSKKSKEDSDGEA
jgi:ATP-dependent exoDNAse (exonuclease V) beta subunit